MGQHIGGIECEAEPRYGFQHPQAIVCAGQTKDIVRRRFKTNGNSLFFSFLHGGCEARSHSGKYRLTIHRFGKPQVFPVRKRNDHHTLCAQCGSSLQPGMELGQPVFLLPQKIHRGDVTGSPHICFLHGAPVSRDILRAYVH